MKAVPGILPTLLEMIYFFSTPTIDVEPEIFGKKPPLFGGNSDQQGRIIIAERLVYTIP